MQVKAEGEEVRPPVPVIPMQIPSSEFEQPNKVEEVCSSLKMILDIPYLYHTLLIFLILIRN